MAIIQQPDALSLSGNLKKFIVSSGETVSFVLKDGATVLLDASYEPGADGRVTIDVKDIVESRLSFLLSSNNFYEQPNIVKVFTAIIDGVETTFKAIRTGVANLADTPANWLKGNFLTWQPTSKPVTYYSPEWLTYYAVEECTIKLKATFPDNTVQNFTLGACEAGKAFTCNLQYAVVAGLLGQAYPSYYEVWAEKTGSTRLTYIQRYLYSEPKSELEQWFLFENSLGGLDTIRAYGDTDFEGDHVHNISSIDGTSSEYRIDTKRSYNQNTGYLNEYERRWLLDFFPSQNKFVHSAGAIRPVIVTDSDVKYTASDLPSSYNFKYRFADESAALLNLIRNADAIPANITIPDLSSPDFSLPPRLSEYPRVTLSEGVILPAFDPFSEMPKVTTYGAIRDRIISDALSVISAASHSHSNKSIIDQLTQSNLDVLGKLSLVDGNLKIDTNAFATGELSAYGLDPGGSSGEGGVDLLQAWTDYDSTKENWAVKAGLLVPFYDDTTGRLSALEAGAAMSLSITGTGNAIASISKYGKILTVVKGNFAELDETGKILSSQLPSYVDDVISAASLAGFPVTGETGKIYIAEDTNKTYRWSGTAYVEISASLALGETSSTAYRGDRGKTAYDHSQTEHQTIINGIGFVKANGKALSYDNNSYSLASHNHSGVYEPVLGNPATNGYLLSSTTAGVRSWVAPYSLPTASASVLGGVKIGTNVSIASGVISVHNPVTLHVTNRNGLSLSTQELSLALATTAANGALSSADKTYIDLLRTFFEYDSTNNAIKALKSLYSTGEISAYGIGSGGSGGGSYDRLDAWVDYDSSKAGWVLSALLGVDLNTRLSNIEAGSALTVNTTGTGNAITSISKTGTVITATKGATFSLDGHTHDYLPLAGGTMSNTNLVTNLNADLLDGYHASRFGLQAAPSISTDFLTWDGATLFGLRAWVPSTPNYPEPYGTALDFKDASTWYHRLAFGTSGRIRYYSGINTTTLTKRGDLAFTTDNVASATKLQTARTLTVGNTGKTFDATANVAWSLAEIGALPLSGGTINSSLETPLILDTSSTVGNYLVYRQSGTPKAYIGYYAGSNYGVFIQSGVGTNPMLGIQDDGTPYFSTSGASIRNTLLHTGNYSNYALPLTGGSMSNTNLVTNLNADLLDGVHYQNILERYNSGTSNSGTATGWFRIGEFFLSNAVGQTCILELKRNFIYATNEAYIFSISAAYNGGISISQLSGFANLRLITKIRLDWSNSGKTYIDLYINSSTTNNSYAWTTIGGAISYTAWVANPAVVGNTYEFTTVNGAKSDKGYTGDLTGNASSATKLQTARTLWGQSFDGTNNVTGDMAGVTQIANGGVFLRHAPGAHTVLSAENSSIYLRPKGDMDSVGQCVLDNLGNLGVTGSVTAPTFSQNSALGGLIHQISATTGNLSQVFALNSSSQLTSETTPNASFFGIATRYVAPNRWFEWYGGGVLAARIGLHSGDGFFNGNVGIGNISPSEKLDVSGNIKSSGKIDALSIGSKFGPNNGITSLPALGAEGNTFGIGGFYGFRFNVLSNGNGNLQIGRFSGGANAYNLILQSQGGNVGIGEPSPAYKLDVNGTGRFTGALTAAVSVTTPKVIFAAAGWSLVQTGTELLFQYNGVTKQKMLSDGSILATGDVTAYS